MLDFTKEEIDLLETFLFDKKYHFKKMKQQDDIKKSIELIESIEHKLFIYKRDKK